MISRQMIFDMYPNRSNGVPLQIAIIVSNQSAVSAKNPSPVRVVFPSDILFFSSLSPLF